jgi:hypothetical protein
MRDQPRFLVFMDCFALRARNDAELSPKPFEEGRRLA